MSLSELVVERPVFHRDASGTWLEMGLNAETMQFIDEHVGPESVTLETGSGLSTVLFAMKGALHTAITPAREEIELIRDYCRLHEVSMERISFKVGVSERILPTLETAPLDLVLIDGRHGFPAPFIDWFYTAGLLKVGGYLIIDDILLWTCGTLKDFLSQEPEWELVSDFSPRNVVFRKIDEGSEWKDWTHQQFVLKHSLLGFDSNGRLINLADRGPWRRALGHLRRGELLTLGRKVARRIRS